MFYNEKEGHQQVLGLGIRKNQEEMPGHFISRPERCSVIYVSALVLACVQGGQLSNQNPNKHAPDTRRPEPAATETASPHHPQQLCESCSFTDAAMLLSALLLGTQKPITALLCRRGFCWPVGGR